jgi:hypothetical protein
VARRKTYQMRKAFDHHRIAIMYKLANGFGHGHDFGVGSAHGF